MKKHAHAASGPQPFTCLSASLYQASLRLLIIKTKDQSATADLPPNDKTVAAYALPFPRQSTLPCPVNTCTSYRVNRVETSLIETPCPNTDFICSPIVAHNTLYHSLALVPR